MGSPDDNRPHYDNIRAWIAATSKDIFELKRREAEFIFRRTGITFAVYSEGGDPERLIPFDIIPRVIDAGEWDFLSTGLAQRVRALNAFIGDVYGKREFVRAGKIPAELVYQNSSYLAEMNGLLVPQGASRISPASTSCVSARRNSMCWRTIAARRRASPTCWRTAR